MAPPPTTAQAPTSPLPPSGRSPSPIQAPPILRQAIVLLRERAAGQPDAVLARFATEQSTWVAPRPGSLDTMIQLIERSHRVEAGRGGRRVGDPSVSYR